MPTKTERDGFNIPQLDGAKDEVTKPYTYAYNGSFQTLSNML